MGDFFQKKEGASGFRWGVPLRLNCPKVICLYNAGVKGVNFSALEKFVRQAFGGLRVKRINLKKEVIATRGLLFDFLNTNRNFSRLKYVKIKDACHILLTDKLFATLDENKKPHIRASIYSFPSLISTSGIVEGPARPKEYYLYKQKYAQLGLWEVKEDTVKKKFKAKFIDYHDRRMNAVLKGYLAQAIFFHITQEAFCAQKACRLYNSHWQEDLIYSQIKCGRFCRGHQRFLEKLKKEIRKEYFNER